MLFAVLGPLLVFAPKLAAAKRAGLGEYGTLAQRYIREFDRKRLLVAHEHATRKPPAGIQVWDAWRYLLGAPLKA